MFDSKFAQWMGQMDSVFGLDLHASADIAQGELSCSTLGQVATFQIAGTSQVLYRSAARVSQAENAPVKACVMKSGTMFLTRKGEEDLRLRPGEIAIYDTSIPYRLHFESQWDCTVMTVQREQLSLPERTLDKAFKQLFASPGAGEILMQLIDSSVSNGAASKESSELLGHAAIDLLAGLVYEKAAPYAPDEALRIAVHSYIRENLASFNLSVEHIARAHRLGVRTLHRLFQHEEIGVAELIRTLRLEAVYRDLRDPRLQNLTILTIGMNHGIQSQAHLTRLFRAKYGVTPAVFRRDHANSVA